MTLLRITEAMTPRSHQSPGEDPSQEGRGRSSLRSTFTSPGSRPDPGHEHFHLRVWKPLSMMEGGCTGFAFSIQKAASGASCLGIRFLTDCRLYRGRREGAPKAFSPQHRAGEVLF